MSGIHMCMGNGPVCKKWLNVFALNFIIHASTLNLVDIAFCAGMGAW